MRIIHYKKRNLLLPAILKENKVFPIKSMQNLNEEYSSNFSLLIESLKNIETENEHDAGINVEDLLVGPYVPNPQKLICIGLNYRKHAIEGGMDIPTVPVVFTKYNNRTVQRLFIYF